MLKVATVGLPAAPNGEGVGRPTEIQLSQDYEAVAVCEWHVRLLYFCTEVYSAHAHQNCKETEPFQFWNSLESV